MYLYNDMAFVILKNMSRSAKNLDRLACFLPFQIFKIVYLHRKREN